MSVKRVQRSTAGGISGPLHMLLPPAMRGAGAGGAVSAALPQLPYYFGAAVAPQAASSHYAHSSYSTSGMLCHGAGAPALGPLTGASLPASSVAVAVGPDAAGPTHAVHVVRSLAPWVPMCSHGGSMPDETTGSAVYSHPGAAASGSLALSAATATTGGAGAGSVGGTGGSAVSLAGYASSTQHSDSAVPGSGGAIAAAQAATAAGGGPAVGGGSAAALGTGGASLSSQQLIVLGLASGSNAVLPSLGGGMGSGAAPVVGGMAAGAASDADTAGAAAAAGGSGGGGPLHPGASSRHMQLPWQEHGSLGPAGGGGAAAGMYMLLPGAGIRTTGARVPPQMSMMTTPTVEEHEECLD